jgi:Tfp pilus assembly protein PilF
LGLNQYLEAANEYRNALVYAPSDVTAWGNYGIALTHLGRYGEALRIFETISETSTDAAEIQTAFILTADIYDCWGKSDLAKKYQEKATALEVKAAERRAEYKRKRSPNDRIAALADALMHVELQNDEDKNKS